MAGHCVSLTTWNSVMLQSVKVKRVDVVWKFYGDMLEYDVVGDVDTIGYLVQTFCMENNTAKGHKLLRQVLEAGHVPSNAAFNKLITAFCKSGNYAKVSTLLHTMIAKNCSLDIHTYQEVIHGVCKRRNEA
ncbi:Pentatricopeptide repeat-containing protein [Forsythia ovata]|uniref:Pentatricopeptide repeat-containing protein n=1 Tax=Forsythia ovata TaxID=205694 RepID=A0ABD1U5C4_9LAMI